MQQMMRAERKQVSSTSKGKNGRQVLKVQLDCRSCSKALKGVAGCRATYKIRQQLMALQPHGMMMAVQQKVVGWVPRYTVCKIKHLAETRWTPAGLKM